MTLYSEALRQFPRTQATIVVQAMTEEASSQFGPRENPPPLPALMAELRKRGRSEDMAPTFTGRTYLVVSDVCVECGQRITDKEFEDHVWDFVPPNGPCTGRIHERCQAARDRRDPPPHIPHEEVVRRIEELRTHLGCQD
jgi:hypothetical protein